MNNETPRNVITEVAPRILDLRSEFEAQLRAIGRVEHQLTRAVAGKDPDNRELIEAVRRDLSGMLRNNKNIHDVLTELAVALDTSSAGT